MTSRLTGSQRIRLDREILTSGVTMSSWDSTRHRYAAEQTLLEQKLHDLDLQRRKSIQAINSEQEKSLLRFVKTKENNKLRLDKSSIRLQNNSHSTQSDTASSKPKDILSGEDHQPGSNKSHQARSNSPSRVRNKGKPVVTKTSSLKTDDSSSIYDAYFSYTPSFLLEEYKKEEQLAKIQNQDSKAEKLADDACDNSPKVSVKRNSISNFDYRESFSFQPQVPDQTSVPPQRRRAQSLHVFYEDFPISLLNSTSERNDTFLKTSRISNSNRRNFSLPDAKNDLHGFTGSDTLSFGLYSGRNGRDDIRGKDTLTEDKISRRLSEPLPQGTETIMEDQGDIPHTPNGTALKGSPYLKLTAQELLPNHSPKLDIPENEKVSKSSLVSDWIDRPGDINWAQARSMTICTDKLHYKDKDIHSEKDSVEELGSFARDVKRKIYMDNRINTCYNSSIDNNIQKGIPSEVHPYSSSIIKKDLNDARMSIPQHLLLRRRSSDKNETKKKSIGSIFKNSIAGHGRHDENAFTINSCDENETQMRKSRQNSNEDVQHTGGDSSVNTGKRGSVLYNFSIKSRRDSNTEKDNGENDRGQVDQYYDTENPNIEGLKRTVSFDNSQRDTNIATDSEQNSVRHELICERDTDGHQEGNGILHTAGGRSFPRGKTLLKKILLEASAKQLTSCFKRLSEENESAATGEISRASSAMFKPRGSICESTSQPEELQHNPGDVSFRTMPTSATPRRPSGAGNFFLVASALKSGPPLNKLNLRRDRNCRRSVSCIPSDHPCAVADYNNRTTSVKRLADAHALLQRSAMCMVQKDKDIENPDVFA